MTDRIVLLTRGDRRRAREIVDAFGERTGMGCRSRSSRAEHRAGVFATRSGIDRDWPRHLALGPPDAR